MLRFSYAGGFSIVFGKGKNGLVKQYDNMSVVTKEVHERRQEAKDVQRDLRTSCVSALWASDGRLRRNLIYHCQRRKRINFSIAEHKRCLKWALSYCYFYYKLFFLNDALGGWFHCEIHIFKTEAPSTCPVVLLQAVRMYCEENFFKKCGFSLCPRCRLFKSNHWVLKASSGMQAGWAKLAVAFLPTSLPSKETQTQVEKHIYEVFGVSQVCEEVDPDDEAATRSAGYTDD